MIVAAWSLIRLVLSQATVHDRVLAKCIAWYVGFLVELTNLVATVHREERNESRRFYLQYKQSCQFAATSNRLHLVYMMVFFGRNGKQGKTAQCTVFL